MEQLTAMPVLIPSTRERLAIVSINFTGLKYESVLPISH